MAIQKKRGQQIWLDVHLYIGLTVGFIFALMGLTGSVNVFRDEIDEFLNPQLVVQAEAQKPLSLGAILASAQATYPQAAYPSQDGAWWFILRPDSTTMVSHIDPAGKVLAWMNIDPYTGKIIRTFSWGGTAVSWVYNLHDSLLAGNLGRNLVGIMGLMLLVSGFSGLYLWWPLNGKFRRQLTIKRGANRARFIFDLHQVAGIYSLAVLIILAVSGINYIYPEYLGAVVNVASPVRAAEKGFKSTPADGRRQISISEAVAAAHRIFPGAELKAVVTPRGPDGVYELRLRQASETFNKNKPQSAVWLDQYSGAPLHVRNPENFSAGEGFLSIQASLHSGQALGLPGRILIFLAGLILPTLYVTGLIRWLDKRKARKPRDARVQSTRNTKVNEGE